MISAITTTPINSPCVRNCCLNDDDICLGCYRSLREITQWSTASDLLKLAILERAQQREASAQR